jgi:hypothetical protein
VQELDRDVRPRGRPAEKDGSLATRPELPDYLVLPQRGRIARLQGSGIRHVTPSNNPYSFHPPGLGGNDIALAETHVALIRFMA